MWSHEAEHGEGGNGREGGKRKSSTEGTQTQRTPSTKTLYEDEPEVMETEVKEALRHNIISDRKSAGCDGIPIELLKAGGEEAVKVMTGLCNCIWKRKEWPKDWKKSVYVPIYKKGDKQECGNYRTIALISHASNCSCGLYRKDWRYSLSQSYQ